MNIDSKKVVEIIDKLNFEKACEIICNGLSDRMPSTIEHLKSTKGINAKDLEKILLFEGLNKSEILKKLKQEIISKRDAILHSYEIVFAKVDEVSPNAEFTKNQTRESIYTNILLEGETYRRLSQFPSDWNNTEYFGRLWAHAILASIFSLKEIGYKKHSAQLSLGNLMESGEIWAAYRSWRYEYTYIDLYGFEIPVPGLSLAGLKSNNVSLSEISMLKYAKGFLEGYHANLIPFVDTAENRKAALFNELIGKGGQGFTETHNIRNQEEVEYKPEDMYESGVFQGKRYKAWEIVFQTPNVYIDWFRKPLEVKKKNHQLKRIIGEVISTINIILAVFFLTIGLIDLKNLQSYIILFGLEAGCLSLVRGEKKVIVQFGVFVLFSITIIFNYPEIQTIVIKISRFLIAS